MEARLRPKGMALGFGDRDEPKMELPRPQGAGAGLGAGAGAEGGRDGGPARDQDGKVGTRSGVQWARQGMELLEHGVVKVLMGAFGVWCGDVARRGCGG